MATLTRLEAKKANISDLTGLEGATNLKSLWLDGEEVGQGTWRNSNSVSDLSPLVGVNPSRRTGSLGKFGVRHIASGRLNQSETLGICGQ